jgi:hypothetical protein
VMGATQAIIESAVWRLHTDGGCFPKTSEAEDITLVR